MSLPAKQWSMQWAALSSTVLNNASSSFLRLKTQPRGQETLAGQDCRNGPWETGGKRRCHLGHVENILPFGPNEENDLSQVLALLATQLQVHMDILAVGVEA